jgi:hypothetical protein
MNDVSQSKRDTSSVQPEPVSIDLRDPWLAAFLAWLVPGLGHMYQRRWGKGRPVHDLHHGHLFLWALAGGRPGCLCLVSRGGRALRVSSAR